MGKGLTKSQSDIRYGALWFFGGLIVTIGTYILVSDGGGGYLIAWGPVIFGLFKLIKGVIGKFSGDNEIDPDTIEPDIVTDRTHCPGCNTLITPEHDYCQTCGRYVRA